MTKGDQWFERLQQTQIGRLLNNPLFVLISRLSALVAIVLVIVLFYTQSQESRHASQVARHEARAAVAQAHTSEQRAAAAQEQAKAAASAAQAKATALAKAELCKIVAFNADTTTYPPTTQRGYQLAELWREFGNSPPLSCGIK